MTKWEQIAEGTYASADWRYVIEERNGEWWVLERGVVVRALYSLERAQAWVNGEVIR
jgi:hypothetical protein